MLNKENTPVLETLLHNYVLHLEDSERTAINKSIGEAAQVVHLSENETLCVEGEAGDCFWIIIEGTVGVSFGGRPITERGSGKIIGEQALLRKEGVRTATLKTLTSTKLCRIEKAALFKSAEHRSAWFRMIAIGLSEKLSEATKRRKDFSNEISGLEDLIGRFVCDYSLSKVRATIGGLGEKYVRENFLIWFSDLAGFSKHVEHLEPENAAEIVRRLMKIQADILSGHNAHIDKFMGDAVMAFWVVGEEKLTKYSDDAVQAAFEALEATKKAAAEAGFEIGLRIGLHFGGAMAGNFGTDERIAHTLIGPNVNLAARYEQAKESCDGSLLLPVRLSPSVYEALSKEPRSYFKEGKMSEVKHGLEIPIHDGPIEKME